MNFTTTTMFAPRIWGSDFTSPQSRVALDAGWRRADILWEELMVAGNTAWLAGDRRGASRAFRRAGVIAALAFVRDDLRRATRLANQGILARAAGREAQASALLGRALRHWDRHGAQAVAEMQIAPRARSSLFHLRMEALHRDTYHDNLRARLAAIAAEVRGAIASLQAGTAPGCRLFSRWRGERPTVYDDTRKVIGACLLIVDAGPE